MIVVDTSALIGGFDPLSFPEQVYSTPSVEDELVYNSLPWTRFRTARESGRLRVQTPCKLFFEKINEFAKNLGDILFLSNVDLEVLALALELKTAVCNSIIITDDYSIQNVANQAGIEFAPLITFGIRFRQQWIFYCPSCFRKYPPRHKNEKCQICGTTMKRKPLRKTELLKQEEKNK